MFWLKESADNGNALAQVMYSGMFLYGFIETNVPYNEIAWPVAIKYIELSANQGFANGQVALAYLHSNESQKYLALLSEQAYDGQEGISLDPVEYYKWHTLAINRYADGVEGCHGQKEFALVAREHMIKKLKISAAQIAEAVKRADQWENAHPDAYKTAPVKELGYPPVFGQVMKSIQKDCSTERWLGKRVTDDLFD